MKPRYSIQNQSILNNPVTNEPLTGDRLFDGDTVLGEWYDTGNEVMAPKIVAALNTIADDHPCTHNEMVERKGSDYAWKCTKCGLVYGSPPARKPWKVSTISGYAGGCQDGPPAMATLKIETTSNTVEEIRTQVEATPALLEALKICQVRVFMAEGYSDAYRQAAQAIASAGVTHLSRQGLKYA